MKSIRLACIAAILGVSAQSVHATENTIDLDRSDIAVRRLTDEVERLRSELEAIRSRLVVAEESVTSFARQIDGVEQQNASAIALVEQRISKDVATIAERLTTTTAEAAARAANDAVRDMQGRQSEQSTEISSALAGYRELRERVDKYQASALEQEKRLDSRFAQMARDIEVIAGAVSDTRRVSAMPQTDTGELNAARLAKFTAAGDDYRVQLSYDDETTAARMARFLTANGVSAEAQSVGGKSIVSLGQFSDLDAARKQSNRINRRFELATEVVDGSGARL